MLRIEPVGALSRDYRIYDGDSLVTTIDLAMLREAGRFELDGNSFEIGKEKGSRDFILSSKRGVLCRASKPSFFSRRYEVRLGDQVRLEEQKMTLEPAGWFGRGYIVRRGDHRYGSIQPKSWASRKAESDLPDSLPLEVRVFLVWLVLMLWRRAAAAASSAG